MHQGIPFRLDEDRRREQLERFNRRAEIHWFGFEGAYAPPDTALLRLARVQPGVLGGGGTQALNGGVISAGFDGVFVLAGLGHYDSEVVVTLELSVRFLSLAEDAGALAFRACVVRSTGRFAFVEGRLARADDASAAPLALASGLVAPARPVTA